jgi:hypothetical protein
MANKPIKSCKELYEEYALRLGKLTIAWSELETAIDTIISYLAYDPELATIGLKQLPHTFERKIEFLKVCHKSLPQLSGVRREGLKLLERVADIREERHTLTHCAPRFYLITGDVTLTRYRKKKLDFPVVKPAAMNALRTKIDDLTHELAVYSAAFLPDVGSVLKQQPQLALEVSQRICDEVLQIARIERPFWRARPKARHALGPKKPKPS